MFVNRLKAQKMVFSFFFPLTKCKSTWCVLQRDNHVFLILKDESHSFSSILFFFLFSFSSILNSHGCPMFCFGPKPYILPSPYFTYVKLKSDCIFWEHSVGWVSINFWLMIKIYINNINAWLYEYIKSVVFQWSDFVFNGISSWTFFSKQRMMKEISLQQNFNSKWSILKSPAAPHQLREGRVCHHG